MKTRKKVIPKIKNYKEGFFVEAPSFEDGGLASWATTNVNGVNSAAQLGASGVNMLQPSNGDTNTALSGVSGALSGAGEGAKIGSMFGPEGTVIGAGVGLVGGAVAGLVSGHKKHEQYLKQQEVNTQNAYFNTRGNMQTQNVDPYGMQMAFGDFVGGSTGDPKPKYNMTQTGNLPPNNDPYWKANPLLTQHDPMVDESTPWGYKPNPYIPVETIQSALHPHIDLSDKALGQSSIFYPSNSIQVKPAIPTIHSNTYANGASVGLSGKASGRFSVPNAGLRRFAPHMQRVGRPNPLPSSNLDLKDNSTAVDTKVMENGGTVDTLTNTQQNMINIQKGELLIDPSKGNILQEYNGVNPLTGGLYENHAKGKEKESPNNFTMADPGLFVITKKTAKQYKEAVDNNDKISQKTVLMNIRNAKIAKEGGLQPLGGNYASGDEITSYGAYTDALGVPNQLSGVSEGVNPQLNNFGNTQINNTKLSNPELTSFNTNKQSSFSKVGDAITNYGPALYNIGQGLFGNAQHQAYATPTVNPYASNVIANMPKNVNMTPVINDIYNNQELANHNLEGQTNSSAVYRANRQALASGTNRSLSDARMKSAEINNQAAGQRAYMYNALGYQNQQEQDKVRDYNLGIDEMNNRATAAKQNLLNAGLSQLQQTTQNEKANTQKAGMDKYALELLSQTFPNTKFYNQFQIDYINKLLGRQ